MTHETKTTLIRAEWEKIKRANAKRVREIREKGKDGEKEDRGREQIEKNEKKRGW